MTNPVPTIGRIVHYQLTEADAERINARRKDAFARSVENQLALKPEHTGKQVHVGNAVFAGDVYPMIIVRVWSDGLVNGQVLLDGSDSLWVTSVAAGEGERHFTWPSMATGGAVPAPTPPSTPSGVVRVPLDVNHYVVELSPTDRELLKQIAENTKPRTIPNAVPGAPTLPFVGDTWSWRNPVIYGSSGTQVNSTFDHQGERP